MISSDLLSHTQLGQPADLSRLPETAHTHTHVKHTHLMSPVGLCAMSEGFTDGNKGPADTRRSEERLPGMMRTQLTDACYVFFPLPLFLDLVNWFPSTAAVNFLAGIYIKLVYMNKNDKTYVLRCVYSQW